MPSKSNKKKSMNSERMQDRFNKESPASVFYICLQSKSPIPSELQTTGAARKNADESCIEKIGYDIASRMLVETF